MSTKKILISILAFLACCLMMGCQQIEIDTLEKWCDNVSGVDLESKYGHFWAVITGVSFNDEAVRDDIARKLNVMWMEKAKGRTDKMVWREGMFLHVINPSSLWVVDKEDTIKFYREGLDAYFKNDKMHPAERCLFGAILSHFNYVIIHNLDRSLPWVNKDTKTIIDTRRDEYSKRLGKYESKKK